MEAVVIRNAFQTSGFAPWTCAFRGVATYTAQQSWPEVWDQLDQKKVGEWKPRAPWSLDPWLKKVYLAWVFQQKNWRQFGRFYIPIEATTMAALRCAAEKGDINELQKRLEGRMKGFSFLTHIVSSFQQQPVYKAFKNPQPELNVDFVKKKDHGNKWCKKSHLKYTQLIIPIQSIGSMYGIFNLPIYIYHKHQPFM